MARNTTSLSIFPFMRTLKHIRRCLSRLRYCAIIIVLLCYIIVLLHNQLNTDYESHDRRTKCTGTECQVQIYSMSTDITLKFCLQFELLKMYFKGAKNYNDHFQYIFSLLIVYIFCVTRTFESDSNLYYNFHNLSHCFD